MIQLDEMMQLQRSYLHFSQTLTLSLSDYTQLWSLFLFSRISLSLSSFHMIRALSLSLRLNLSLKHSLTASLAHTPTHLLNQSLSNLSFLFVKHQ